MRIALSQINLHVGNFAFNKQRMLSDLESARTMGADLVVFPELSVCGYPPGDMLLSESFIDSCLSVVESIAQHCRGIAAIVGSPSRNPGRGGKPLYNSAFLLVEGKVLNACHKGLLPTYDVFNEYRYFEPAVKFSPVEFGGEVISLTICEDIWNIDAAGLYTFSPPDIINNERPSVMINISASPFAWNHRPERMRVLSENARKFGLPLFSCNLVGGQSDLLLDGGSAVFNGRGEMAGSLKVFDEDLQVFDTSGLDRSLPLRMPDVPEEEEKFRLIKDALVMGVRDYFRKSGLTKAVVGLSGGIDSAVCLVIAAEALGRDNVWAVLMPGPYSSDHSVVDAVSLADNLGVSYDIIPISDTVNSFGDQLGPLFENTDPGIAEENIQARTRAVILMALSNKFGHILLNTSNKSEAAVGYTTLYGDMCGALSVLGDVYKTEVYGLARLINRGGDIIPRNTIVKPPSAELRPNQKDSDSLPDYGSLDAILYSFLEKQMDMGEIVKAGHDRELVKQVIELVCKSEHKRRQSPPILRVSSKCLGLGREMPLEADYSSFLASGKP